jgi:hypothetical protein
MFISCRGLGVAFLRSNSNAKRAENAKDAKKNECLGVLRDSSIAETMLWRDAQAT